MTFTEMTLTAILCDNILRKQARMMIPDVPQDKQVLNNF